MLTEIRIVHDFRTGQRRAKELLKDAGNRLTALCRSLPAISAKANDGQTTLVIHIDQQYSREVEPGQSSSQVERQGRLAYPALEVDDTDPFSHSRSQRTDDLIAHPNMMRHAPMVAQG